MVFVFESQALGFIVELFWVESEIQSAPKDIRADEYLSPSS